MNAHRRKITVAIAAAIVASATAVVVLHGADTDHGVQGIRGSGVIVTQTRAVEPFAKLELSGAANVDVTVGGPVSVALRGDDNLLGLIDTSVDNGTLLVSQHGSFTNSHGLEITVSTPALTGVSLVGAGDIAVRGVHSRTFTALLSGAGRLDVDGRTTDVRISLTGAGEAALEHLLARDATAVISGTGSAHVFAGRSLDATVSGVGDVIYVGGPSSVTTHLSGVGVVVSE